MNEEIKKGLLGIVVDETTVSHVVPELLPVHKATSFIVTLYTAATPFAAKAFFVTNKNKTLNNIIYTFFILICSGYFRISFELNHNFILSFNFS